MTMDFKASIIHRGDRIIPIVDEYDNGVFKRSLEFIDAPKFDSMFQAYDYARKEAENLKRKVYHEKQ